MGINKLVFSTLFAMKFYSSVKQNYFVFSANRRHVNAAILNCILLVTIVYAIMTFLLT